MSAITPRPEGAVVTSPEAERFTALTGHAVKPYPWPVLLCPTCGCLFSPDEDGESYYPDRYMDGSAGKDDETHDDAHDCPCHKLDYAIDLDDDGNAVVPPS